MTSDSVEKSFRAALGSAIVRNDTRRVRSLLARGCSPDSNVWDRWDTALFLAVRLSRTEIVRILLDAGASPHPSATGRSPLVDAMRKNSIELVDLLLQRGAKVDENPSEPNWFSAGEIAALSNRTVLLKRLLVAGMSPTVCIQKCFSLRAWPKMKQPRLYEPFELLYLERCGKSPTGRKKRCGSGSRLIEFVPLFLAAIASGSPDSAAVLLENGADRTAKDSDGFGLPDYLRLRRNVRR